MENPLGDITEIFEGDVEVAGKKIPKAIIIGGLIGGVALLAFITRKQGNSGFGGVGDSFVRGTADETALQGGDSSSPSVSGTPSESYENEQMDLAQYLSQIQQDLQSSFQQQFEEILSGFSNPVYAQPYPDVAALPVDGNYYPVNDSFGGLGYGAYEQQYYPQQMFDTSLPSIAQPVNKAPNQSIVKNLTGTVNKATTAISNFVQPKVTQNQVVSGTVTNFGTPKPGSNLASLLSNLMSKPQPIPPSPKPPNYNPITMGLASVLGVSSKPPVTTASKPVTAVSKPVSSIPVIGAISVLPKPKPANIPIVGSIISAVKPPTVKPAASPKPVSKPASNLILGASKPLSLYSSTKPGR